MAGGTHIFDMMKRLQNNDARKKKGYFKTEVQTTKGEEINDIVNASPEELKRIRESAIDERREDMKRSMRVLVISAAAVLMIAWLLLKIFNLF